MYIIARVCPCDRFHLCASEGRIDCLEVVISHGADLNVPDGNGMVFYLLSNESVISSAKALESLQ